MFTSKIIWGLLTLTCMAGEAILEQATEEVEKEELKEEIKKEVTQDILQSQELDYQIRSIIAEITESKKKKK